jgi:general L-amino acid transport system permease protein
MAISEVAFVRNAAADPLPPPMIASGPIGWLRANLFSSPFNIALTLLCCVLIAWLVPPMVRFLIIDAVWTGADREACLVTPERPVVGACWAFVRERFAYFVYGSYPLPQRWRVDVFFALLALGVIWLAWLDAPRRDLAAIYCFIALPIASYILLSGLLPLNLAGVDTTSWMGGLVGVAAEAVSIFPKVDTTLWGGVLVTIVVAAVGMVASLPIGILLALGRRSHMPAIRLLSVIFIEFVRGVPLITVLFMASVMLPLFVPPAWSPDKLLRALVGVALFASAYMAEAVRAGLQAIPRGQYEAAMALGLSYWRVMGLVILPQALRITIPNIVNTTIGLFKDTTLVFVVGIFDLLKTIEVSRIDPKWATPVTSATGYAFAALFYFVFCYAMSRYARSVEARLAQGDRR